MKAILTIAFNTYRESVRSKILYSIFFFAILIVAVSSVFGLVTIGDQIKVIKDFGLFSLNLFGLAYVVITGSALLHKELSRKTIFNILSKPISRMQFVFGKFLGMFLTFTVMLLMMSVALMIFVYCFESTIDSFMFLGIYSIFLQIFMICALAILFSAILVTPFLSGAIVFSVFVIGRSSEFIVELIKNYELTGPLAYVMELMYYMIPHLDKVDLANQVVYRFAVDSDYLLWNTVYAVSYSLVALLLASWFFSRREFN